eukprot:1141985-Pelagomonas_calceolata.AAC.3
MHSGTACSPFGLLVRLVDSSIPCMGKVYHRFYMLARFAKTVAGDADVTEEIQRTYTAQHHDADEAEVSLGKT